MEMSRPWQTTAPILFLLLGHTSTTGVGVWRPLNDPAAYAVGGSLYHKKTEEGGGKEEMKKTRPVYGLTMILPWIPKCRRITLAILHKQSKFKTSCKRATFGHFQDNYVSSFVAILGLFLGKPTFIETKTMFNFHL